MNSEQRVIELEARIAELESKLEIDELTGLYNRSAFYSRVQSLIDRSIQASPDGQENGDYVVFMDMDGLKLINDGQGHDAGDKAIQAVAEVLKSFFRRSADVTAHLSGDEFAVMITRCTADQAFDAVARVVGQVYEHGYSISAGIAAIQYGDTAQSVISRADEKMYESKRNGRNQVAIAA